MKYNKWNIDQVNNLAGKIIIVTGANSGLGFEATKIFASKGATVIMACRSMDKADQAKKLILSDQKNANLIPMIIDLANLASINSFALEFKKQYTQLDVLLNNAGILSIPYSKTIDGLEMQNGVNHLGHFALTAHLFDILKKTKSSRIVNLSSLAHIQGKMDFDNFLFEKGKYKKMKSYARSKLSILLFTFELDRRIKEKGYDIKVLAAHPGFSSTDLGRHMTGKRHRNLFEIYAKKIGQIPAQGCLPEVRASLDENALSGQYYGPSGFMQMKGDPVLVKPNKKALNIEAAKTLWTLSEKLTKVRFDV